MLHSSLTEFADRLNDMMPLFMKEFFNRQPIEFTKLKLTLPQFFILNFLHKQGSSKMTDIAHFVNVSTAATTGIVDRLVKSGYVVRVSEPHDRRVVKINLTAKGTDLVMKANEKKRQMVIEIFSQISQQERDGYLTVMMHVKDILAEQHALQEIR